MPTSTYDLVASATLSSPTTSITFSSIPSTYRDLVLVVNLIVSSGSALPAIRPNNDANQNYSLVRMYGDGSSVSSSQSNTIDFIGDNSGYDNAGFLRYDIFDYAQTDKHKSFLIRSGQGSSFVIATAARWANTAAITSIVLGISGYTLPSGTKADLYGIVA